MYLMSSKREDNKNLYEKNKEKYQWLPKQSSKKIELSHELNLKFYEKEFHKNLVNMINHIKYCINKCKTDKTLQCENSYKVTDVSQNIVDNYNKISTVNVKNRLNEYENILEQIIVSYESIIAPLKRSKSYITQEDISVGQCFLNKNYKDNLTRMQKLSDNMKKIYEEFVKNFEKISHMSITIERHLDYISQYIS